MDATEHFEDAAAWLSSTPAAANLSNDSKLEVGKHPIQVLAILGDDLMTWVSLADLRLVQGRDCWARTVRWPLILLCCFMSAQPCTSR
jgi:hypothetical protein